MTDRVRIGVVLMLLCLTGGCAELAPWDRYLHAKPEMAFDRNPIQAAVRSQTFESKEAASGGNAAAGAGCGCN